MERRIGLRDDNRTERRRDSVAPITMTDGNVAAYIRRSTSEQENEHQNKAIEKWLDEHDVPVADVEFLRETASGSSRNREEFTELMDRVENDAVDHVVVWELSRIAREGELANRFFNLCEDNDVTVHVTSGSPSKIEPDGSNRFVAEILSAVYAEERRTLIQRTKHGQQRALDNGKWIGKPPLGFTTDDDGYLTANLDAFACYNDEADGYYAVEKAIQMIHNDDASYRGTAGDMICSRRALANVCDDEDRRRWFLEREAEDDRVQAALDEVTELEENP